MPTATSLLRGATVLTLIALRPAAGCGSKNTDKKADDTPAVARNSAPNRSRVPMPSTRPRPRLAAPDIGGQSAGDPPRLPDRRDDGARRQRFHKMRAQYDKNGDGSLDNDERTAMRKDRLARSVETIDSDGDGKISRDEADSAPRRIGRMLRDFEAVDTDGDGYVSTDELEKAMSQRRGRRMRGGFRHRPRNDDADQAGSSTDDSNR